MREITGTGTLDLPSDDHLLRPLFGWSRRQPDRPAAAYRDGDRFTGITSAELAARVRRLAKGLISHGVAPGDRIALMSRTRLEWTLLDHAILAAGAVTVPIYETSSAEQIRWICEDSAAMMIVLETPEMLRTFRTISTDLPGVRYVVALDALDALASSGDGVDDAALDTRVAALGPSTLATIVYTSGTTGRPKGCMLTHGNLRANVLQSIDAVRDMLRDDDRALLFLPLAHVLSRGVLYVCVEAGIEMCFASDITKLAEEMPMVRPTMVAAVPRIFEKVFDGARRKAHAEGHARIFEPAAATAVEWSRQRERGRARPRTEIAHRIFDRLVYRKLRAVFGGRLRFAFSGGGPLGERLTHFFNGAGVVVYEGYGLTETSPVLTINGMGRWRIGTVGRPVAGTTIAISDDGEICAKGPQVFGGYWRNEAASRDTFDRDGWFRTGDIGTYDADGYLRITGRKKELLVTAAGKNVAPAPLEDALRAHPLVSQALVVGDARPFVAALITLDPEALVAWAGERGEPVPSVEDAGLAAEIQHAVDAANATVSRAESIRRFVILPEDLSIEGGQLTPTLKIRREVVMKEFGRVVEDLYAA